MPEADPVPVELVSVGDHLLLVADALARPTSTAARDLKLFVLHRTIAAMPSRSATGRFLTPLANAITTAIGHNVAADRPDAFVAMLRGCGRFLVDAGSMNDRIALVNRRDAIAASLTMVGRGAPAGAFELQRPIAPTPDFISGEIGRSEPITAPLPRPAPEEAVVDIASLAPDVAPEDTDTIVGIETLAPDEFDVVPIESLAPDAEPEAPTPRTAMPVIPAEAPGTPSRLELAFARRRTLPPDADAPAPTLSGLIGAEIVPIASLLYRGSSALARADEVRTEIYIILADPSVSLERLRPHIHELLDLVPLARGAA